MEELFEDEFENEFEKLSFTGVNGHQGDTFWFGIKQIPESAKKIEKQFIARSERSGSVHALFGEYDMYAYREGFIVKCKEDCIVNHTLEKHLPTSMNQAIVLPKKDHRHSVIPKGSIMYVGIHQRVDPLVGIRKNVID